MAVNLIFLKNLLNFISTLYIFACKSVLLQAILKIGGHRKAGVEGGGACYVHCGKMCPAL